MGEIGVPIKSQARILIADDHDNMRIGLAVFLETHHQFELVGEAANGLEAIELTETLRPDIVLMDIDMPVMDGIQATRILRERYPEIRIIGLTATFQDKYITGQVLDAGAVACVFKNISTDRLAKIMSKAMLCKLINEKS